MDDSAATLRTRNAARAVLGSPIQLPPFATREALETLIFCPGDDDKIITPLETLLMEPLMIREQLALDGGGAVSIVIPEEKTGVALTLDIFR